MSDEVALALQQLIADGPPEWRRRERAIVRDAQAEVARLESEIRRLEGELRRANRLAAMAKDPAEYASVYDDNQSLRAKVDRLTRSAKGVAELVREDSLANWGREAREELRRADDLRRTVADRACECDRLLDDDDDPCLRCWVLGKTKRSDAA